MSDAGRDRREPGDPDYNPPHAMGCWICYSGNGIEDTDEMRFDMEFDTYYHIECLEATDHDTISEYEMERDPEHEVVWDE